jgi:hypothetical protein
MAIGFFHLRAELPPLLEAGMHYALLPAHN